MLPARTVEGRATHNQLVFLHCIARGNLPVAAMTGSMRKRDERSALLLRLRDLARR